MRCPICMMEMSEADIINSRAVDGKQRLMHNRCNDGVVAYAKERGWIKNN